jgi:hypothetical protein
MLFKVLQIGKSGSFATAADYTILVDLQKLMLGHLLKIVFPSIFFNVWALFQS